MTLLVILLVFWIVSGIVVAIHEMRHDGDVNLSGLVLCALLGSLCGPLCLVMTLIRKSMEPGVVVIRRKHR